MAFATEIRHDCGVSRSVSLLAAGFAVLLIGVAVEAGTVLWISDGADGISAGRPNDQGFVDVSYYDLIKDPMPEVARVYEAAGAVLTPEARAAMEASRKVNKQHKYGKHKYSLADFGLTKDDVEPRIAEYRARFNVPYE